MLWFILFVILPINKKWEFLFKSHVFEIRTCTQLHFHWIERGNVSRVNSNHFKRCHKATETRFVGTLWRESFTTTVYQSSFVYIKQTNTKSYLWWTHFIPGLMQKYIQLDSWTWYKYLIDVKLARGTVLDVWRNQWRVLQAIQTAWKTFTRVYPMRMKQSRCASGVITNSVCDLRSTAYFFKP